FGNGEETRDHLFVDDLCRALFLSLERRSHGELNVASGRAVSFIEVAKCAVALVGSHVRIESVQRKSPVTHRHFDVTGLAASFPTMKFTELARGLAQTQEEAK